VADRFRIKIKQAVKSAFASGRKALSKVALKKALKDQDEKAVVSLASKAIEATKKELKKSLLPLIKKVYAEVGKGGVKGIARNLRAAAPKIDFKFDITNPRAVEWVKTHALELIDDLSKTTSDAIRDEIEASFVDQFDVDELADKISELIGDDARAELIARTESMAAANAGQQELWAQATEAGLLTGDETQEWITTPDDRLCAICEPMDGVQAPMGGFFDVEGEQIEGPPAHPDCRCTLGLTLVGTETLAPERPTSEATSSS
jgi:hypothetical protein